MTDDGEGVIPCPACGSSIRRGVDPRCVSCGIDANHPALDEILAADATLYEYKATYDELLTNWQALSLHRNGLLATLVASRFGAPAEANAAAAAPNAVTAIVSQDGDPFAAAEPSSGPSSRPARAPKRTRAPKPERQAARRLTAPALLGVSGASLLITSAIVFIAVTWDTFFPLAQGLIILAVAAATSYLSLWLGRHDLSVSGGAVGVVAMSFVGVAVVAFDRQAGDLGSFAIPVAFAFTAAAGLALSRAGVLWVGAAAALALGAAATGLTRAIALLPRVDDRLAWAIAGPALALLVLATFRLWVTGASRLVLRVVGVALLALSVLPLLVDIAWNDRSAASALVVAVPIVALVVLGVPWPRFTLGPASALATTVVAAIFWGADVGPAQTVIAIATTTVIIAAGCAFAPISWRNPVLLGLVPAGAAIAAAATVVAVQLLFLLGRAGHVAEWFPFSPYSGIAVIVGGIALAAPGLWRPRPRWLGAVAVVGAVFIVVGVTEASYSIAIHAQPWQVWAVSMAFNVGAVACITSALLWRSPTARWVAGVAATLLATIAGLDGAWSLAVAETPWVPALALALVPVGLLLAFARRWPRVTLGSATLIASAIGAGVAYLNTWERSAASAGAILVVAAILWIGARLPLEWRIPVLLGASPSLALAVGVGLGSAGPIVAVLAGSRVAGAEWAYDLWTSAATALAGVGIAALATWKLPDRFLRVISAMGAGAMTLAAAATAVSVTDAWGGNRHSGLAVNLAIFALASAALTAFWSTKDARRAQGVGATLLLTIAGIHGSIAFAAPSASLVLGLAVVIAPVAILLFFARWWPAVTLGSASFLFTAALLATNRHCEMSDPSVFGMIAAGIAIVAWLCWIVPKSWHTPLLIGIIPAALGVFGAGIWMVLVGLEEVFSVGSAPHDASLLAWAIVGFGSLAVGGMAARRWRSKASDVAAIESLGALAAAGAAVVATALTVVEWDGSPAMIRLAALAYACVAALTARAWSQRVASWVAGIATTGWVTLTAFAGLVDIAHGDVDWWQGLGVAVLTVMVLGIAALRWPRVTIGSASLLASAAVPLAIVGREGSAWAVAFGAVATVAVGTWMGSTLRRDAAAYLRYGLVPVGAYSAGAVVAAAALAIVRMGSVLVRDDRGTVSLWSAGIAAAAFAALASLPVVRRVATWVVVPFLVTVSASLPGHWTWVVLGLIAAVTLAAYHYAGPRLHLSADAVMVTALAACAWAARSDGSLALMTGVVTVMALSIAVRHHGQLRERALWFAPVTGAISLGSGALALGLGSGVALAAAMLGALGVSIGSAAAGLDRRLAVTPSVVGIATVVIPFISPALTRSGVTLIIAGAGWLALAVLDWRPGRWISSGVLSLGTALVLAGAHVNVVEAYVAVPATTVLAIGLWWLVDDPEVDTLRALGPGLAVWLVPSLVTLATDPAHLARTLSLTATTIVLAFVGVTFRWFAPILATCVTAVTVSFTQVFSSEQIVPRWVSFGIVGSLLLAIAATYEKLKKLR